MITYHITLTNTEREQLETITRKGSHRSQKVLNALILLNCDQGEFQTNRSANEQISNVLGISMRKIDRVKKRFVEEGLETALHGVETNTHFFYSVVIDGNSAAQLFLGGLPARNDRYL